MKTEILADDKGRLDKALTVILIITIIISIAALVYVIVTPKQGEKFTEFYILGPGGKAYDYPTSVQAGNKSTVIVGVVNHEYTPVNYTMQISLNNTPIENNLNKHLLWNFFNSFRNTSLNNTSKQEATMNRSARKTRLLKIILGSFTQY